MRLPGALRAWPWAVAIAAVLYAGWSFDWAAVGPAIARMPAGQFILVEGLLLVGVFAASAGRWMAVTNLLPSLFVFLQVYAYTSLAVVVGQVTPMQLGEALKIKFAQISGLPVRRSAVSLLIERLVDLAVIVDLAGVGLLQRYHAGTGLIGAALLIPLTAVFCASRAAQWARRRFPNPRASAWLGTPEDHLSDLRLTVLVALTIVKWVTVALLWQFALRCVGCLIGLADCMLTVATVSVISMLSMVPGGFGVQELSLKPMLVSFGTTPDMAEAGSIAIRLVMPLMIILGLLQSPALLRRSSAEVWERTG